MAKSIKALRFNGSLILMYAYAQSHFIKVYIRALDLIRVHELLDS